MSLIHDSLRKLENNQSSESGLDSNFEKFKTNKGFNVKKLWMIIAIMFGLAITIYAYLILTKYQNQNEMLMNDINLIKINEIKSQPINDPVQPQFQEKLKPEEKLVIQEPVKIVEPKVLVSNASLLQQVKQEDQTLIESKLEHNKNADFILQNVKNKIRTQPIKTVVKKKRYKAKINKKLSIKETRHLVNNLQIQIDSKNTQEVENLLNKLALSSGENSIVYLRMNAYWSTTIKDSDTAAAMYKKILFQKPSDIQANTNLALLEANNGQIDQAVNRLKILRIEYPSNKNIVTYLDRIEGMYDK